MIKRLAHIVILLLLTASLPLASALARELQQVPVPGNQHSNTVHITFGNDSTKTKRQPQNRMDVLDRNAIKEVPKPKRQPKPEKIIVPGTIPATSTSADTANNKKARSKRRPDNMERPPDIIRRNNN